MIVSFVLSFGSRKAYRSVLSAAGSPAMRGASRWLDARIPPTELVARIRAPVIAAALDRVDTDRSPVQGCGQNPSVPSSAGLEMQLRCVATPHRWRCRGVFAAMGLPDQWPGGPSAVERRKEPASLGGAGGREARIRREGEIQVATGIAVLAERRFDCTCVVAQERVDRAEPEGLGRVGERLTIATESME